MATQRTPNNPCAFPTCCPLSPIGSAPLIRLLLVPDNHVRSADRLPGQEYFARLWHKYHMRAVLDALAATRSAIARSDQSAVRDRRLQALCSSGASAGVSAP